MECNGGNKKTYSFRIYKVEHWDGENVVNVWDTTDTSCSVQLTVWGYKSYIDSSNALAYTISNAVKFSVGKAAISSATITGITDRTYNGSPQTQFPTVKIGNKVLPSGTDYSLAYSGNMNEGMATLTITGKGNCMGSVSKTIKINTASITGSTVAEIMNKTYTGLAQTQNPTVEVGDRTLTSGTDYAVYYKNNTNAGTARATGTGKGSYKGSTSKTFKINTAVLKLVFERDNVSKPIGRDAFINELTKTTDGTTIKVVVVEGKNYKAGTAEYEFYCCG